MLVSREFLGIFFVVGLFVFLKERGEVMSFEGFLKLVLGIKKNTNWCIHFSNFRGCKGLKPKTLPNKGQKEGTDRRLHSHHWLKS